MIDKEGIRHTVSVDLPTVDPIVQEQPIQENRRQTDETDPEHEEKTHVTPDWKRRMS